VIRGASGTALLRPPLCFGYPTTEPAPGGRRPQVPELRILVGFSLATDRGGAAGGSTSAHADCPSARYALAPEPRG
jgi:hypothetical protein